MGKMIRHFGIIFYSASTNMKMNDGRGRITKEATFSQSILFLILEFGNSIQLLF